MKALFIGIMSIVVMFLIINITCLTAEKELITLTPKNTVTLRGEIDDESVSDTIKSIIELRSENEKGVIYLVLKSPGGSIGAGIELIRFLRTQDNIKTISIFAASMASGIVEANKGERLIVEDATLMFHRAAGGFRGFFNNGEVESELEYAKKIVGAMEEKNAERMGMSLKEYKEKVVNEYWLYGKEAIEKKAADRIVLIKCSKELAEEEVTKTQMGFFGPIESTENACPLL